MWTTAIATVEQLSSAGHLCLAPCSYTAGFESDCVSTLVLRSPTYRADKIGEKDMTLVATRTSTITALFELVLESVHGTDQMEEQQEYAGTLKGTEPLKTCTFGCVYCPTEVDAEGEQVNPKSYLTHESGVSRALRNRYSTVDQVHDRIRSLVNMGHNVSKVNLCIHSSFYD
eukprot:SAG31_NODE_1563_length_7869_cov_6.990734_2_plen_172_part_00